MWLTSGSKAPIATGLTPVARCADTEALLAAVAPPEDPQVRAQVRRLIEPHLPSAAVLGYNEISKGVEVESLGLAQLEQPTPTPADNGAFNPNASPAPQPAGAI